MKCPLKKCDHCGTQVNFCCFEVCFNQIEATTVVYFHDLQLCSVICGNVKKRLVSLITLLFEVSETRCLTKAVI